MTGRKIAIRSALAAGLAWAAMVELFGWAIGSKPLIGAVGSLIPMHPYTAVLFVLAAVSLWCCGQHQRNWQVRLGRGCTIALMLFATARLIGHWLGASVWIDQLLFPKTVEQIAASAAPMAFQLSIKSCASFVMIGSALLILQFRLHFRFAAFVFAAATALLSLFTLTGYLFLDVTVVYRTTLNFPMAVATAIGFLILSGTVAMELASGLYDTNGQSKASRQHQNEIAGGFAAAVFTLCGVGIFSYQSISQFMTDSRWDNQSYQVLAAVNQLSAGLKEIEGQGRGYVITDDEAFLETRPAAITDITQAVKRLAALTAEHPSQKQRLYQLQPLIEQKLSHANELVELRREAGFISAQKLVATGHGRQLMNKISQVLNDMRDEENGRLAVQSRGTQANARRGLVLITTGTAISLVIVSLAAWLLYRDSNARARAAEALQASTTLYRSLLESAPVAIVIVDTDGKVNLVNAQAERVFGYISTEMVGLPVASLLPDLNQPDRATIATGAVIAATEMRGIRKDGTEFPIEISQSPMQTAAGMCTSTAIVDISARKQQEKEMAEMTTALLARACQVEAADEELRQTMDRFRALVESAKEYAIFMLDPQGKIKTWNIGAQRIKGYTAEEAIGRHFSCFYSAEERASGKPDQELVIAVRDGQFSEDGWRQRADGSRFFANVVITPIKNDQAKLVGYSQITRDLTERIRAEEQSKNFFTLSIDLLCIAGKDGYFKRLNSSWQATLGFTDVELRSAPLIDFVHPDDRERTILADERLARGDSHGQFENRFRCKDGTYRWLLWKSTVSSDSELIYAAATDITERKQIEGEVVELNKTLQRQNLRLETANKELESFSYSVSHDLRAPLRSIDGFSQAILDDCGDALDAESQDHLQRVRAASQRMGQLIDDLLNLSRVSRGELRYETTDLSKIAREVIEELRSTSAGRQVEVLIEDNLFAEADPRLIRIVFTNLLGNAWKFTAKNNHSKIAFGSTTENGQLEYFVRDNGAGFNMNYAGKLFGAFQRLHSDSDFPGTGIGLATVQRIVLRHGGQIRADSKPGEGATFFFSLVIGPSNTHQAIAA